MKKSVNWSKIALSTNFDIVGKTLRERPFNLKGEGGDMFFFQKNILIPNVAEKNILILVEETKII